MNNQRSVNKRFIVYACFCTAVILGICAKLFSMQIISGDYYFNEAMKKGVRNVVVPAPRGEILDRFGKPLVTNKVGYALQIQRTNLYNKEFDDIILKTYKLAKSKNQQICEKLPISFYPYQFTFSDTSENEQDAQNAEKEWKKRWELDENYSADEVMEALKKRYNIADGYNADELRMIIGVRYDMTVCNFSVSTPYILAENIDMELVTTIKENEAEYPCVSVVSKYFRQFPNNALAAHILGRVGKISDTEYEALKKDGYKMTDEIGKQGIEKVCESYLKGKDGKREFVQTSEGFEENQSAHIDAVSGNYAVLTIDSEMQKILESSLASTIENIRKKGAGKKNSGADAAGGSAVILDVNSGDVLAMATNPTYDANKFSELYTQLLNDENKPMWNRAIGGAYAPGSTFKMLTSIAALEENVITPSTVIRDEGIYKYYKDYQPKCWIYTKTGRTHGDCTVSSALENSCNYFYYETGRKLGIEKLNKYEEMFGLGQYSGIEISSEEAKGTIAGPAEREKAGGREWSGGDTIQAAIGQSDNLFTPIQLANYVATLVNGGKRYKPHLVKEVRSPSTGEIVYESKPEILNNLQLKDENVRAVMQGMLDVTQEGTASGVFEGYPIKVGGKTGSAQVAKGSDTGVFVAFAPYDDPQIAIAVVVEHGNSGGDVAPVARAVFDYYFNLNDNLNQSSVNQAQTMTLIE